MNNHFANIADTKQLEDLVKQSAEAPVVVFKHSTTCPVSAGAYEEMSAVTVPVNIVIVQEARDVSNQIEQDTKHLIGIGVDSKAAFDRADPCNGRFSAKPCGLAHFVDDRFDQDHPPA